MPLHVAIRNTRSVRTSFRTPCKIAAITSQDHIHGSVEAIMFPDEPIAIGKWIPHHSALALQLVDCATLYKGLATVVALDRLPLTQANIIN